MLFDTQPEGGDRLLDHGAPVLLLLERNAFHFGFALVADVGVAADPAAARQAAVHDQENAAVRDLDLGAGRFSLCHIGDQLAPEFRWIAQERTVGGAVGEDVAERRPRRRDRFGQFVECAIRIVAEQQALIAVEHAQALRHVVERHQPEFSFLMAAPGAEAGGNHQGEHAESRGGHERIGSR
jgi:hypothetical protein